MGLDFSPVVVSHIHQRFGGHPFFIRQLCSQIHKRAPTSRPRTVSINACKEAERDAIADLQGYMREILGNLKSFYPDEYAMLEYLARGDTITFKEMAEYASEYIERLLGYGLVIRRGDDYEPGFDAVAEAVKRNLIDVSQPSRDDKWKLIGSRRNTLEQEIRSALYRWAARLSPDEWSKCLGECVTQTRLDQLGAITRREAFSRNNSPLYFIELLKFIRDCDEFGSAAASPRDISTALDAINKFRIDAHAQDISDTDYETLNNAFDLLEDVFLPPA
jgi:hypothetical protein